VRTQKNKWQKREKLQRERQLEKLQRKRQQREEEFNLCLKTAPHRHWRKRGSFVLECNSNNYLLTLN